MFKRLYSKKIISNIQKKNKDNIIKNIIKVKKETNHINNKEKIKTQNTFFNKYWRYHHGDEI